MKKRPGRPGLAPGQARRVRAAIRTLLRDVYKGNQTKLADALGLTPPTISQILSEKNNPSFDTASRVARETGQDVGALLGAS